MLCSSMVGICIWLKAYAWIAESGIWVAKKVLTRCFPSWRVHAAQTIQSLRSTWCSDQCVSATKEESDYKIHDKSSSKNIYQTSSDSNTLEYQWINKETGSHFDSPIYTVPVLWWQKLDIQGANNIANQSQHERQYHNTKNAYPWFSSKHCGQRLF